MSTMYNITTHLIRIKAKLTEHPVFVRGRGVPVDDPGYAREAEELDRLSDQLKLQIRNLSNHMHLLSAQEQGLWNLPRERRFGAAAAISQQQAEADRLMQTALDLRRLLDDLLRRNGLVSDGEIAAKIGEYSEEMHRLGHSIHQAGQPHAGGPAYLPVSAQYGLSPEMATIAAYAALRALSYFLRGRKGKAA